MTQSDGLKHVLRDTDVHLIYIFHWQLGATQQQWLLYSKLFRTVNYIWTNIFLLSGQAGLSEQRGYANSTTIYNSSERGWKEEEKKTLRKHYMPNLETDELQ